MEIIIGREQGARRLHCVADGREFNVGQAGTVPTSVSRQHCKIVINGSSMSIENLKDQNITYVDGNQVFSKSITATSKVQLGNDKYLVPLQQVIQLATGTPSTPSSAPARAAQAAKPAQPAAPTFSLRPLKSVWEEYDRRKLEIQNEAAKRANQQRVQGIISMFGMALGLLPIPMVFRAVCVIAALGLAIYFFMQGQSTDTVQQQLHDLDEEFAGKYKCPNPKCGKPFGNAPYRQIEFNKQCFACGCKYTH